MGNKPCNMSDFKCSMPHFDTQGNWRYDDCGLAMKNRKEWEALRNEPVWHDTSKGSQLPYIHEYWDKYHGIHDDKWWYEAWGYNETNNVAEVKYDDYTYFDEN